MIGSNAFGERYGSIVTKRFFRVYGCEGDFFKEIVCVCENRAISVSQSLTFDAARFCDNAVPSLLHRGSIDGMASNSAHHATGWAAGLIAAVLVAKAGAAGPWHAGSVAAFVGGVAGGTAPDWMEVAWWSRARRLWITHRTVTHWGLGWAAALVFAYESLHHARPYTTALFGFACGGLMHLFADWPNPLGVPWIWKRHSLNLWKSGRCDLLVVALAWAAACWVARQGLASVLAML
jgi:membrane-bound metal-dependent hydrolase YbcI (DUF457 family)